MTAPLRGSIGRLDCRATVVGAAGPSPLGAATTVDDLVRRELPAALAAALDTAFADRDAVHVLRTVHCTARVSLAGPAAESLARAITAGVVDAVHGAGDPDVEVVTFGSTAEFVAHFLRELARGTAWNRWYLRSFRSLRGHEPRRVLVELDRADRPALRAAWPLLAASGDLSTVLAAADDETVAQLWEGGTADPDGAPEPPRAHEWSAVARLARDLARDLGWVVEASSDVVAVGRELARTADTDPDWSSPAALTAVVVRAVALLATPPAAPETVSRGSIEAGLAGMSGPGRDWLDTEVLLDGLREVRTRRGAAELPTAAAVESPRRAAVTRLLADLVAGGTVALDPDRPATARTALWAALVEDRPDIADADWVRGAVHAFVREPPRPGPRSATSQPDGPPSGPPTSGDAGSVQVRSAGVMLLARTLDALRLPPLCRRHGLEPATVLRTLAQRWAGPEAAADVAVTVAALAGDGRGGATDLAADAIADLHGDVLRLLVAQHRDVGSGDVGSGDAVDEVPLRHAHVGVGELDRPLDLLALTVLREWGRWLRGFEEASPAFLLSAFVRRSGRLTRPAPGTLGVSLAAAPHDVVLEMSGCLQPLEPVFGWTAAPPVSRLELELERGR